MLKKNQGITLIALVITIIVLIILAGITISMILGENGILSRAQLSAFHHELEQIAEQVELKRGDIQIQQITEENAEALFREVYATTSDTPSTLIQSVNEAREKEGKPSLTEDADGLFYINKEEAGKEHEYIYDVKTGTVFKIRQTIIAKRIYHYVRTGIAVAVNPGSNPNPNPGPGPGPGPDPVPDIEIVDPEPIDPEPEVIDYKKYIPIYSVQDMGKIASGENWEIKGKTYLMASEAVYVLQNDIDFGGASFTPIPEFKGIFYGKGFTLSNFNIDNSSSTRTYKYYSDDIDTVKAGTNARNIGGTTEVGSPTGLFSRVIGGTTLSNYDNYKGGKIHYVNISNAGTVKGKGNIGIIAGDGAGVVMRDITINSSSKTIIDNTTPFSPNGSDNYSNASPVIGYLYNSSITSEFININIKNVQINSWGNKTNTAGIVATLYGNTKFESCFVDSCVGLQAGLVDYVRYPISAFNCWVSNLTLAENYYDINKYIAAYTGGLISQINATSMLSLSKQDGTVTNIYNCGVDNITFPENCTDIGGIIGNTTIGVNFDKISIKNLKNTNNANVGGLVGGIKLFTSNNKMVANEIISTNNNFKASSNASALYGYVVRESSALTGNKLTINKADISNNKIGSDYNAACVAGVINTESFNPIDVKLKNVKVESNAVYSAATYYNTAGFIGNMYGGKSVSFEQCISTKNTIYGSGCAASFIGAVNYIEDCEFNNCESTENSIVTPGYSASLIATVTDAQKDLIIKKCIIKDNIINGNKGAAGIITHAAQGASDAKIRIEESNIQGLKFNTPLNNDNTIKDIPNLEGTSVAGSKYISSTSYVAGVIATSGKNVVVKSTSIKDLDFSGLSADVSGLFNYIWFGALRLEDIEVDNLNLQKITPHGDGIGSIASYLADSNANEFYLSGKISNINISFYDTNIGQYTSHEYAGLVRTCRVKAVIAENTEISNINIQDLSGLLTNMRCYGLFGYCMNGLEINKNAIIKEISIKSTANQYVTGIVGVVFGGLNLNEAKINNITIDHTNGTSSGIAYYVTDGEIKDSEIKNITINQTNPTITYTYYMGGIINFPYDFKINNSTITKIYTNITGNYVSTGGIFGCSVSKAEIDNSTISDIKTKFNSITESSGNASTINGGIIGLGNGFTIKNSTVSTIEVAGTQYTGGIAGIAYGTINNITVNSIAVTGDGCVGGIAGVSRGLNSDGITASNLTVRNVMSSERQSKSTSGIPFVGLTGGIVGINDSDAVIKNVTLTNSTITNGHVVGGIMGFASAAIVYDNLDTDDVTINAETGKTIYAAGGIIGHGSNSSSMQFTNCDVARLTLSNAEFGGGIAGIAANNIKGCTVSNSTISVVSTNTLAGKIGSETTIVNEETVSTYQGGFAGGIIASGGYLRDQYGKALYLQNNTVSDTTITAKHAAQIYGSEAYYLNTYTGEKQTNQISNCIYERVTATNI